jgi:16S rRNA processing protein RimM
VPEGGHLGTMLDVGRVVKPHGVRGELVVELWTNRTERMDAGSVLWSDDGRQMVIASSRPHQGRYLVWLEGVGTLEEAESLRSRVLRAPEIADDDVLWVHDLLGARVVTTEGRPVGTVSTVEANPASDLLVLDGGQLVPLTFVVEMVTADSGERTVVVDLPAGLLE